VGRADRAGGEAGGGAGEVQEGDRGAGRPREKPEAAESGGGGERRGSGRVHRGARGREGERGGFGEDRLRGGSGESAKGVLRAGAALVRSGKVSTRLPAHTPPKPRVHKVRAC